MSLVTKCNKYKQRISSFSFILAYHLYFTAIGLVQLQELSRDEGCIDGVLLGHNNGVSEGMDLAHAVKITAWLQKYDITNKFRSKEVNNE